MTMTAIHVTSRLQYYSMSSSSHVLWRPDIYVTSIILITLHPGSCNILLQQQSSSQSRTYIILLCAPPAVFCDKSHPVTNLSSSSLWTTCNVLWHGPTARYLCHDCSIIHHPTPALCCNDWPAIHVTTTVLHIIQLLYCAVTTDEYMSRVHYYSVFSSFNGCCDDSHLCHENSSIFTSCSVVYCDDLTAIYVMRTAWFYIQHLQCSPSTVTTWQPENSSTFNTCNVTRLLWRHDSQRTVLHSTPAM